MAASTAIAALVAAILAFISGLVSSYLVFRGQKMSAKVQAKSANTEQVETIFGGYSQMVMNLQQELARMRDQLEELRTEQEACEERNRVLEGEIVELKQRIVVLEANKGDENAPG